MLRCRGSGGGGQTPETRALTPCCLRRHCDMGRLHPNLFHQFARLRTIMVTSTLGERGWKQIVPTVDEVPDVQLGKWRKDAADNDAATPSSPTSASCDESDGTGASEDEDTLDTSVLLQLPCVLCARQRDWGHLRRRRASRRCAETTQRLPVLTVKLAARGFGAVCCMRDVTTFRAS
jgi:hypothetical protein